MAGHDPDSFAHPFVIYGWDHSSPLNMLCGWLIYSGYVMDFLTFVLKKKKIMLDPLPFKMFLMLNNARINQIDAKCMNCFNVLHRE